MQSKTPQFDEALNEVFKNLVVHKKECAWKGRHEHCEGVFEVSKEDIEFLKMLRVPPPSFCPTCRRMKRLVHLNLTRLFLVSCEKEGHGEALISVFPKEKPFPIWDTEIFQSLDDYFMAREFISTKTPYENFFTMRREFPVPNFLNRNSSIVDSPYASGGANLKNGYYVFGCFDSEDVWYTNHTKSVKNVMDSRVVTSSEFVYGSIFSRRIYKCSFVYFSKACTLSMFLYDCRDCTDCFGCVNLRNKSYCIYNVQYTKDEYEKFIKEHFPYSREFIEFSKNKFFEFVKTFPINASRNIQSVNAYGILLEGSTDVYNVVDAFNSQHTRYADGVISHKDSMDVLFSGGNSHHLYMCTNVGSTSSNVLFSVSSKYCLNSEFIFNCKNLTYCFMCFGLQNKSYCILNTQYTEEEYFKKVDSIKVQMLLLGEYADGVGLDFSAQAYNFSLAQYAFPLNTEQVKALGGYWGNEPESNVGELEVISPESVPQTILETTDNILDIAILCPVTKRPFRIVQSELEFLRRMNLPLPILHPSERMKRNFNLAPEGKIFSTVCHSCSVDLASMYNPEDNFLLYCVSCFREHIY